MPISYIDVNVMCPFYNYSDSRKHKIACEGIVDNSCIHLFFQNRQDFQIQMDTFCCEHYTKCEVFNMLMNTKYPDE